MLTAAEARAIAERLFDPPCSSSNTIPNGVEALKALPSIAIAVLEQREVKSIP